MPSKSLGFVLLSMLLAGLSSRAEAQLARLPLAVEVRLGSGVPTGDFASRDPGIEAGPGLAYSIGGVLDVIPLLGVYAHVQQARFACAECGDAGVDETAMGNGVEAGVEARVPFRLGGVQPWVRGGVVRSTLRFSSGESSQTSEPGTGFALGAGVRLPLAGIELSPGVRYQGYPAEFRFTNLSSRSVDVTHLTVDLGLLLHF